jgi:hypothetical protein
MPKAKKPKSPRKSAASRRKAPEPAVRPASESNALAPDDEAAIMTSNLTLHDLFQQQTTVMLDRADLSEEQKQSILIGMSCPCCGAGGFSFTAKLKRGT